MQNISNLTNLQLLEQRLNPTSFQCKTCDNEATHFKKSISQIKSLIQQRNSKVKNLLPNNTEKLMIRSTHLLKTNGADIESLEKIIQGQKQNKIKESEAKSGFEQHYFLMKEINKDNFEEFVLKNFQYSVANNLQFTMNVDNIGQDIKKKMLQKARKHQNANNNVNVLVNMKNKNEKNRKKYQNLVKELVNHRNQVGFNEVLKMFAAIDNESLISTFYRQMQNINIVQSDHQTIKRKALRNSVKILQNQYSHSKLSLGIELSLKTQYLNQPEFKHSFIYTDSRDRPIWGYLYLMFRAGRTQQIKNFHYDSDCVFFLTDYLRYLENQSLFKTCKFTPVESVSDIFLQQMYGIFNSRQSIRPQIIKTDSDLLWAALKMISVDGVRLSAADMTLKDIRQHAQKNAQKNDLNLIKNVQLCLGFDFIFNQSSLPLEDRVNLFIVMAMGRLNFLFDQKSQQRQKMMKSYSEQMLQYGLDICLNYVSFINNPDQPEYTQRTLECLEQILIDHNRVQEYFGVPVDVKGTRFHNSFKKSLICNLTRLQQEQFVDSLCIKYKRRYQKYSYCAQLYGQFLKEYDKSIECVIQYFMLCCTKAVKPDREELDGCKRIANWLNSGKNIKEKDKLLLRFLENLHESNTLIQEKDYKGVISKISAVNPTNSFNSFPSILSQDTKTIIDILRTYKNGSRMYLYFLKTSIKCFQISVGFGNNKKDLQVLKKISDHLQSFEKYVGSLNKEGKILLEEIKKSLQQ